MKNRRAMNRDHCAPPPFLAWRFVLSRITRIQYLTDADSCRPQKATRHESAAFSGAADGPGLARFFVQARITDQPVEPVAAHLHGQAVNAGRLESNRSRIKARITQSSSLGASGHHHRSHQPARPTPPAPTRTPRHANTVAPLDHPNSCKDVASMFLGCSLLVPSFVVPLFVPSCPPRSRHPRHAKTRALPPRLPPSARAPSRSTHPASRQPTVGTPNIETAAAFSRLQ